jgi:hypothetical protein
VARVIALVGTKGGSGKSTAAHLIAHGCGSLVRPVPTVVLTTDPEERPRADRRRYLVRDARTAPLLLAAMRHLLPVDRLLIVLDGAAARPDLDRVVAENADLAVLPFRAAAQDAERAAESLARLPASAVALPIGWPRHPGTLRRARRFLEAIPEDRRMAPFPHMPRLAEILAEGEGYAGAAYELATPARGLALEVLRRAGVDPDDLAEAPAAVTPERHGATVP